MSTSKVIFTYKRKRLSSRSGVDHADICTDFSLDVQTDKQPDVPNKKVKIQDKDPTDACCGDTTCSRKMILDSDESLGDHFFENSVKNVLGGECSGEMTAVIKQDYCIQQSSSNDSKGLMNDGSVSQLEEHLMLSPLKESSLCEVTKGKSIVPLRTFSRRLKRKLGAPDMGLFTGLPLGEGDMAIKECDSVPRPLCASEVGPKEENNGSEMRNMVCHNSEKMITVETGNSSCLCRQSRAESPISRHNEMTSASQEGMAVDNSPSKLTANRISGSISNCHNLNNVPKDELNCSTNDEAMSSWNTSTKIDEQPLSQLQASSGDSQLTSGDSSDLKQDSCMKTQHGTRSNCLDLTLPPPGALVIDCNVVPECDVKEDASDIIQGSSTVRHVIPEVKKSEGLELFGDKNLLLEDSSGVHTSLPTQTKHNTTYLQLFPDNENHGELTPSNTQFEIGQSPHLAQSHNTAPPPPGLSLSTEQKYKDPTSKEGPILHQFQNPNIRIHDLIQNPRVQSFPDPASLRHKLLLETINTRATSLRGNRNISLENFDPTPTIWSEEELDSLWIGIRRYGRGHWRAMLLDPRLRFAPWRVAGELEEQWERELYKLFSGQNMPSNRFPNPQDSYKLLHYPGGTIFPGTSSRREIGADTRLSLGDLYGQRDQNLVTMASSGPGGYGFNPFNNVQANGMSRVEVLPDNSGMGIGMNNCLPHWLRDSLPPSSNLGPIGGIRHVNAFPGSSGTSCKGVDNKVGDENPKKRRHLTMKKGIKADNVIVIDSDVSSEETISDDNNVRS